MKDKKLYKNPIVIIITLLLFAPVGIFLLWKYTSFNKYVKIVLTAISIIFLLALINMDATAPEIKLKNDKDSEISLSLRNNVYEYPVGSKITDETIKKDIIVSVSDNKSELSVDDVQIDGISNIDTSAVGSNKLTLTVTDKAENTTSRDITIKIYKTEKQKQKEADLAQAKEEAKFEEMYTLGDEKLGIEKVMSDGDTAEFDNGISLKTIGSEFGHSDQYNMDYVIINYQLKISHELQKGINLDDFVRLIGDDGTQLGRARNIEREKEYSYTGIEGNLALNTSTMPYDSELGDTYLDIHMAFGTSGQQSYDVIFSYDDKYVKWTTSI